MPGSDVGEAGEHPPRAGSLQAVGWIPTIESGLKDGAEESTVSLVLDVSKIESMTTGLSRKIWQQISLLHDEPRLTDT